MTDQASNDGAPAEGDTTITDVVKANEPGVRPEFIPEDLWDPEAKAPKLDAVGERLKELDTLKATKSEIDATIVDDPAKIDFTAMVAEVKTDDGKQIEFDADDPLFKTVAAAVVEHKVPTAYLKPLVNAFVQSQMQLDVASREAAVAEFKSLGDKGKERVQSVHAALTRAVGADRATQFLGGVATKAQIEVLEGLIALIAEPNPGNDAGTGGDVSLTTGNPGKIFFGKGKA